MIATMTGTLDSLKPTQCIVNVNGIGFDVHIPFSTYERIASERIVTLHIYLHHREDQLKCFGFYTLEEKILFLILIDISGIGPTIALSILSGLTPHQLVHALHDDDTSLLVKIPGIGKSKAEKILFELKRKQKQLELIEIQPDDSGSISTDSINALVSLGFDEKKAKVIVQGIIQNNPDVTLEALIKQSLINMTT